MYQNYAEFRVFERILIGRNGLQTYFAGVVSPALIASMQSQGVKIR
jgi:hypothetical protein